MSPLTQPVIQTAASCEICGEHAIWRVLADDGEEILACGVDVNVLLLKHTSSSAILRKVS